jgi:hypothetical protein
VQRLSLEGSVAQLFGEGDVTLQGRLDLKLAAGPNQPAAGLKTLRLPVRGASPTGLLVQSSNALARGLLYVRVSGTLNSHAVQFVPLSLLTGDALQFFVSSR